MTTYTEHEINIFLEGMKFARKLAARTGKGITASNAITVKMQEMNMQREVARMKGRL